MSAVNWNMGIAPNVGLSAFAAFEEGQRRSALDAFAKNPTSQEPINALIAAGDTQSAIGLRGFQMEQEKYARDNRFRDASARYYRNHPLAGGAAGLTGVQNAGLGGAQAAVVPAGGNGAAQAVGHGAEPHVLGEPQNEADKAFLEMLQIDPKRAMEMESGLRDKAMDRLKLADAAFDHSIARLANVTDDTTYQSAVADLQERYAPLGIDVRSMVPAKYPGAQGMRPLLMMALDAKDQLHAIVERDKLDVWVSNVEADNARADRNTSSLINTRNQRTNIMRDRYNTYRDDVSADNERADRKPSGSVAGPKRITATGPNGEKVEYVGGKWVPMQ